MKSDDEQVLRDLLLGTRTLTLSLVIEGSLDVSLLPFAAVPAGPKLLVLASGLARHTRGLVRDAPFAALVHESERSGSNPFALARLSLEGRVDPVPREDRRFVELAARYLERLPEGKMLFELGDFGLYALGIEHGRLVAGFARARNVSAEAIAGALSAPSAEAVS